MAQPRKPRNQNTPKKNINPVAPPKPTNDYVQGGLPEDEKANESTPKAECDKPIGVNILSFKKNREWQPIIANIVSCIAIGVSLWLAIVSYRLYKIASSQSNSVIKSGNASASAAKTDSETFAETKRYNKANDDREIAKAKAEAKESEKRYRREVKQDSMQREALELQIQALNQAHDQFIKQNNPYIQMETDSLRIRPDGFILTYYLTNLTPFPVKVMSINTWATVAIKAPVFDKKMLASETIADWYIMKEDPNRREFHYRHKFPDAEISAIKTKNAFIYFWEIIRLKNLINDSERVYEFKVKLTFRGDKTFPYPEFIYNENYDAPKK